MKKTKRQAFGVGAAGAGGVDFISNLPEDVMSSILALVPLRDAVRTSILSKEWRYKWVSIPDVVFNRDRLMKSSSSYSYSSDDDDERDGEDACAHVVDQVVSQLIGPISKFSCVFFSFLSSHHFDRWIGFLSKNHGNGIKEFVFAIERKINWYNVPHSVFHYQELCHLELLNCILELPPTFKGFRNLSVLNLAAKISKDDIECLISECPLLEWLKLIAFDFYQCLNIHAPNLRYLELDGEFRDVSIEACPLLTDVSLLSDIDPPWGRSGFGPSSHIPFIGCLQGIKSLKLKQFYEIARQLRKFHEVVIPGSKEPQLWNDVLNFLDKASALTFDDTEKQAKYNTISFDKIRDAIRELKDLTDLLNAPVVFAHNDLLSGNLMLNDDEGKLYFIDFEYGSYSYRGYDIANHFNEYAGFDCDFSLYPDKDAQYYFFRNYLQPDKPLEVPSEELEALYIETNSFRLASHLYWALWGLIQAKMSPIDFDYLGYFFLRYSEYERQKEMCFSMARSYLSCS